jgi:patatin-like phospholipase/acyl hydrolase
MSNLKERLNSSRPKRILSIDGGGIRGYLTLQILRKIEEIIQSRCGDNTHLCDYFDLIGGTSTGSILAAGLAAGLSLDRLDELYRSLGKDIFRPKWYRKGFLVSKFEGEGVAEALDTEFENWTLADPRLCTGLAVCTKRMDTGSAWVITNLPGAKYADQDGKLLLTEVVRASTAAPHYFDPEEITIHRRGGDTTQGAFVDGGMSPYVNPSLQLLLLSQLEGFGLKWPLGEDQLLIVSVGTGKRLMETDTNTQDMVDAKAAILALQSAVSIMDDCSEQAEMLLQLMSNSPTSREIDSAVGDLSNDLFGQQPWLSYLRYNVQMDENWVKENLGLNYRDEELKEFQQMDTAEHMPELKTIGEKAGEKLVDAAHFPAAFDLS